MKLDSFKQKQEQEALRQKYIDNQKRYQDKLCAYYKTDDGKFVIDCILEVSGVFGAPMKDEDKEFFLGRRHIGLVIYNTIKAGARTDGQ